MAEGGEVVRRSIQEGAMGRRGGVRCRAESGREDSKARSTRRHMNDRSSGTMDEIVKGS